MGKIGWIIFGAVVLAIILLGLVFYLFIKSGCGGSDKNIASISPEVKKFIRDSFSDSDKKIYVYPSEREIELEKGTIGKGFGFSIRNTMNISSNFKYTIGVDPNFNILERCNTTIKEAENYLLAYSGSFNIPAKTLIEEPELIRLNIPVNAKTCTVVYMIDVKNNNTTYTSTKVYVNIIPKKGIIIKFKEFLKNKFYGFICK